MLVTLIDGRGEEAVNGCIVTADRDYGKGAFMEILAAFGVGSVLVMPSHLLRVHPFVEWSFLSPSRE